MNAHILYREFQMQDFDKLADIINMTWHYDEFCSKSTATLLAKAYLSLCLTEQTFTQVAVADNQPVGVIMGNNILKHRCPLKFRLKAIQSVMGVLLSREGRTLINFFQNMDKTNKILLRACHKEYAGELSFFANHPDFRGQGIGKKLFNNLLNYMSKEHIESFYLFTDTCCNYGFYEQQGMRRCSTREERYPMEQIKKDITFFIYEYTK